MSSTEVPKETSSRSATLNAEIAIDMPMDEKKLKRLYAGDIVVRADKNTAQGFPVFGTVIAGKAESEINRSVDGGSSSEVSVHWDSSNKIVTTKVSELSLVDRMLLRGQRVKKESELYGTVTNYWNKATINIVGTDHVVENMPTEALGPVSAFIRGQEVLYREWVGVLTSVKRNVWFKLDGGRSFFIEVVEADGFMKNDPYWGIGVSCPGIRTHFSPSMLKKAQWTGNSMRFFWKWVPFLPYLYSFYPATTSRTEVTQMTVKWLYPAPYSKTAGAEPPPEILTQNEMRFMDLIGVPSSETIGFHSVRVCRLRPSDQLTSLSQWLSKFRVKYMNSMENQEVRYFPASSLANMSLSKGYDVPVKILQRQNEVEIEWDDDTKERILSAEVPYLHKTIDDPDYPSGVVVAPGHINPLEQERYGIVQSSEKLYKLKTKIVPVRWFQLDGNDVTDFGIHEESVYDLKLHPKYCAYVRGTIVFAANPIKSRFHAGTVIDIDVKSGKMIVLCQSGNTIHHVLPHTVTPMTKRCYWNFFSRKWIEDDLVPPYHQLDVEYSPEEYTSDTSSETLLKSLCADNNNEMSQDQQERNIWDENAFEVLDEAPLTHRFYPFTREYKEIYTNAFSTVFSAERKVLTENTPQGIWIRMYENRMDLLSVLMLGPAKTPYEDGLLLFDMQLPKSFPKSPPRTKFISYVSHDISPVISTDGNFCANSIKWEPVAYEENVSNVLSYVTKIQDLVFSPEPYYAMMKQSDEVNGSSISDSIAYNEGVVINVIDSMFNMINKPWAPWDQHIRNHFASIVPERVKAAKTVLGQPIEDAEPESDDSSFPISPMSNGFKIALTSRMEKMEKIIAALKQTPDNSEVSILTSAGKSSLSVGLEPIKEESIVPSNSTLAASESQMKVSSERSSDTMKNILNPGVTALDVDVENQVIEDITVE